MSAAVHTARWPFGSRIHTEGKAARKDRRAEGERADGLLFSRSALVNLLIPLIIEQMLSVSVGMADTMMIAGVGEEAVSGISLVDQMNILIINIFSALATGGAVISAHIIGQGKYERAAKSANQLVLICVTIALAFTALSLLFAGPVIRLVFGKVEQSVFDYAKTYFIITAFSFPFLALYNAGAALCRSMGNSAVSMKISFVMNLINILGNALLIYVLRLDVAGAALSTLASRAAACVIMTAAVANPSLKLHVTFKPEAFRPDPGLIRKILFIGIPIAVENGIFQFGKLIVAGMISAFGTAAIAANAVANNLGAIECMPGNAIALGTITIVGQAVGAKRDDEAAGYARKMVALTTALHLAACVLIMGAFSPLISLYHLSDVTRRMVFQVILIHSILDVLVWPVSFVLPAALRAAEDVKFVMTVSMLSMVFARIVLSYVLSTVLGLGLLGIWWGMFADWFVRGGIYLWRFFSGHWLDFMRRERSAIRR